MSYAAFSQPWPSAPPAFAWPDELENAQFGAFEDYYQEYEPTEHDDESYEPEPLDLRPEPVGMYEIAKHYGATDEEAEHLERVYAENRRPEGIDRKVEQTYHDPALMKMPPHHGQSWPISDVYNKSWTRRKPAAIHKLMP